ncbi:MAG: DUF1302 family protein [Pseudomonadota bacterium]
MAGLRSATLSAFLAWGAEAAFATAQIQNVRLGLHPEFTRLVVDLDQQSDFLLTEVATSPGHWNLTIESAKVSDVLKLPSVESSAVKSLAIQPSGTSTTLTLTTLSPTTGNATAPGLSAFALKPDPSTGRGHRIVLDVVSVAVDFDSASQSSSLSPAQLNAEDPATPGERSDSEGGSSEMTAARLDLSLDASSNESPGRIARSWGSSIGKAPSEEFSAAKPAPSIDIEWSGTWEHELAWELESEDSQKFESVIEPQANIDFSDSVSMRAIGRLRYDAVGDLNPRARTPFNYSGLSAPWFNSARTEVSLRELYFDIYYKDIDFRLGKQQTVWGQADGFKVLDVVNPQSFREFILDDFDDSRIPLWTVSAEFQAFDWASVQLLWIPDTTYHELADVGTPYFLTTPRFIPQLPITQILDADKPNSLSDGDYGIALNGFLGGWDLSLNYLYHYLDQPVLRVGQSMTGALTVTPTYERSHLLGATFSTALGSATVRGEVGYSTASFQATNNAEAEGFAESSELSAVVGVDWIPSSESLISLQWFSNFLFDYSSDMNRDRDEHLVSMAIQRELDNARWRLRAFALHSLNDSDTQFQFRVFYWFNTALELEAGVDMFAGNRAGLFGQFDERDRIVLGFEYSF